MKKYSLFTFLSIFVFMSCSNKEDKKFSCDPNIDNWVKSNVSTIRYMKRTEWLKLDESLKKPVYRAFAPKEKHNFWLDKLGEVINLNWTSKEKEHIIVLYNWVKNNPNFFADDLNQDSKEFLEAEKFEYEWREKGESELGWSKQIIAAITMSGNRVLNTQGELEVVKKTANGLVRLKTTGLEPGAGQKCECNRIDDWCGRDSDCSKNDYCNVYRGCGWFLQAFCDGMCVPE